MGQIIVIVQIKFTDREVLTKLREADILGRLRQGFTG
jgi:hypothetical protein